MPTYARPEFLSEAIECFLRQTYTDSELVILNDWRGHTIHFDHSRVRIFNNDNPIRKSLGQVRNWLCEKAKGDIVTDWDDDDLYLPTHLESAVSMLPLYRGQKFSKQRWQWKWAIQTSRMFRITPAGYLHTAMMDRQAREKVGGYADKTRNSDAEFQHRLLTGGHLIGPQAMYHKPTFIQRLVTGREHVSTGPSRDESDADRHARIDQEAERLGVTGAVHIQPCWRDDYVKMAEDSYAAVLKTGWGND
jgi:glycosyltransferase involved in cell wall biosynthesis